MMQYSKIRPLLDAAVDAASASPQSDTGVEDLQSSLDALSSEQQLKVLGKLPAHQLARALEQVLRPNDTGVKPADLPDDVEDDRRDNQRTKTLRAAKIIYNNKMSVSYCQIRDLSKTGCKITVESTLGIPGHFTLHIQNGDTTHECEVIRRRSDELGVLFIG